jgi:modification target Cys-rich repeat protein
MMGNELHMNGADLQGETNDVCARVITNIQNNLKVSLKPEAKLNVHYKPAVCKVDLEASAHAAAQCEGKADADVGASCTGTCHGTCSGTCSGKAGTGGNSGQCDGACSGTCKGSCEGHANVNASAQCKANAEVHASVDVQCTEPELTIEADAKLVVDTSKLELTLGALRHGLPKILSVKARLEPLQAAVVTWAASAKELADAGAGLAQSFKDQAMCISGQIAGAVEMVSHIQASVHVSVEVSASASGTIGG